METSREVVYFLKELGRLKRKHLTTETYLDDDELKLMLKKDLHGVKGIYWTAFPFWFDIVVWYDRVDLADEMYHNNTLLGFEFIDWSVDAKKVTPVCLRNTSFYPCTGIIHGFWNSLLRGKFRIPIFLIENKILDLNSVQGVLRPRMKRVRTFNPTKLHELLIAAQVAEELEVNS
jgi:hypothetical protein